MFQQLSKLKQAKLRGLRDTMTDYYCSLCGVQSAMSMERSFGVGRFYNKF